MADSDKTAIPAELARNGLRADVARMLRDGYGSLRVSRRMLAQALDEIGDASGCLGTVELADVRAELDTMHDRLEDMDTQLKKHVDRLAALSSVRAT